MSDAPSPCNPAQWSATGKPRPHCLVHEVDLVEGRCPVGAAPAAPATPAAPTASWSEGARGLRGDLIALWQRREAEVEFHKAFAALAAQIVCVLIGERDAKVQKQWGVVFRAIVKAAEEKGVNLAPAGDPEPTLAVDRQGPSADLEAPALWSQGSRALYGRLTALLQLEVERTFLSTAAHLAVRVVGLLTQALSAELQARWKRVVQALAGPAPAPGPSKALPC